MNKFDDDGQGVFFDGMIGEQAPLEFPEYDENIPVDFACVACGYAWSGGAGGEDAEDAEDAADSPEKSIVCPRCRAPWTPPIVPQSGSLF